MYSIILCFGCPGGRGDSGTLRSAKSEESLSSLHAIDGKMEHECLLFMLPVSCGRAELQLSELRIRELNSLSTNGRK